MLQGWFSSSSCFAQTSFAKNQAKQQNQLCAFLPPRLALAAVHFSNNLEHTRHFLQSDCTASISAESSPTDQAQQKYKSTLPARDTRWEATSNNLHRDSPDREFIQLLNLSSERQSLIGAVAVANIAFEKRVTARFINDNWQTISEVIADFKRPEGAHDRFSFTMSLPAQAEAQAMTVILCLRYQVNGQELWDNNSGKDFSINLTPQKPLTTKKVSDHRHPESCLSERYDFKASLRMAVTLVADEVAKCASDSETFKVLLGSSPTRIDQGPSKLSFGSTAYIDLIENLCYFKPSDRLIHRPSLDTSCYSEESFRSSHVIPCF